MRPLLNVIERLRNLMVMGEGVHLPTIVSVLESLAGVNLPRGQGICTRVPLIMQLQENPQADRPQLYLEFNGKVVPTDEDNIAKAINDATDEIAGHGKGVSNTPLTLVIEKPGIPDLTMIDLPGMTRVPVHGQPENIYEQISEMIMEYIRPEESIILNVLSATVDFSTCESIRMSQMVDKTGRRTLAVVTKADKAPEGLLEKVTADDVNIGLGYVCVRNRIGAETYEEARLEEAKLFDTHPLLCKIEKSIVGVPVLAQKLTQIQATMMAKYLPEIVTKINDKLDTNIAELERMPKNLSSVEDAMMAFMEIMGSAKESLRKFLLRGEIDEFLDEKDMPCTARLVEMLNQYYDELRNWTEYNQTTNFLLEETETMNRMMKIIEMEKLTDYTCNPEYLLERNKLMNQQNNFFNYYRSYNSLHLEGFGSVNTTHLWRHDQQLIRLAFHLKMRMTPYWKIVMGRFVDMVALHLRFSVQNLVNKEMEEEIRHELRGPGIIKRMMEEKPEMVEKRKKLNRNVKLLRESAEVVAQFMNRIATDGDYDR
ncbi:hypothetical protein EUGRSUZ_D01332 [Eucalyptus grandis]|uniref:Uncharacterized protein n=1 Tax=Eucalyptus grandis TaxID=71139 RepID=A0ACC3L4G4_EUCGR|nr:hypothetical protein EUGRSUZ_D01332 [Eucalyptus grandis]